MRERSAHRRAGASGPGSRNYGCNTPAASRAPADVPLRRGRLLRPVQRRRHRQLRRLPLELHQQPDRRRRRAHRPRLHAHLHLQLSEPDVAGPGPHARGGDVDHVLRPRHRKGRCGGSASTSAPPATARPTTARCGWSIPSVGGTSPPVTVAHRAPRAALVPPPQLAGLRRGLELGHRLGRGRHRVAEDSPGQGGTSGASLTPCGFHFLEPDEVHARRAAVRRGPCKVRL